MACVSTTFQSSTLPPPTQSKTARLIVRRAWTMNDQPLASLSLTHVHYDPRDFLSYVCAWFALVPQGLCVVYVTLIYGTREIEILLTFAGQLCCEVLNFGLKRLIKEERPPAIKALGKGYGMPSSHSQFVAFFAVYVGLFLFWRHSPSSVAPRLRRSGQHTNGQSVLNGSGQSPGNSHDEDYTSSISPVYALQLHYPRLTHSLLSLATLGLAISVSVSRIYLSYHTPKQVLVGFAAGATFAILWFAATEWARRAGWVECVLELGIVRSARVRDLLCEEDLVELGWQVWEDKRRRRRIGKGKKVRLVEPPKENSVKKQR